MPAEQIKAALDDFQVPEGWVRSVVPPKKGNRSLQYDYGVRVEQQIPQGELLVRWHCCTHSECQQSYQIKMSSTSITDHLFSKHGVGPSNQEKRRRVSGKEKDNPSGFKLNEIDSASNGGSAQGGFPGLTAIAVSSTAPGSLMKTNPNAPMPAVSQIEIDQVPQAATLLFGQ